MLDNLKKKKLLRLDVPVATKKATRNKSVNVVTSVHTQVTTT